MLIQKLKAQYEAHVKLKKESITVTKIQSKMYLCFRRRKAMSTPKKTDEFYNKLKGQLSQTSTWPTEYLYKFIVPTDATKIKIIEDLFDNLGAVITTKESGKGTYTSISINLQMKDPDAVITKYKEVANQVEGVISL